VKGGWNIADCVTRSYDVEGMHVGTVAAGRIGLAVLRRLKPFDMHLNYYDRHRLPDSVEKELDLTWHPNVEDMVKVCDVVTINAPLHPETENLFNDNLLSKMKRRAYLVNTARQDLRSGRNRPVPRKRPAGAVRRNARGTSRRGSFMPMINPFRYFNSSPEVIRLVVMMYVRYPLSLLRNVEDLLAERGIDISHETVRFWWNRFGPMFAAEIRLFRCDE
jgi:hypothetical protein